jgi:hypothetical protein
VRCSRVCGGGGGIVDVCGAVGASVGSSWWWPAPAAWGAGGRSAAARRARPRPDLSKTVGVLRRRGRRNRGPPLVDDEHSAPTTLTLHSPLPSAHSPHECLVKRSPSSTPLGVAEAVSSRRWRARSAWPRRAARSSALSNSTEGAGRLCQLGRRDSVSWERRTVLLTARASAPRRVPRPGPPACRPPQGWPGPSRRLSGKTGRRRAFGVCQLSPGRVVSVEPGTSCVS